MSEHESKRTQVLQSVGRGAGWGLGFSAVMGGASLLRGGPAPAIKGSMRVFLRGRELAAELGERVRDLYAEAQAEHAGPTHSAAEEQTLAP